jgi:hypothetical protein
MKTMILTLIVLAGLPMALSAEVSKEDLKKLAQARLTDDLILNYIKSCGPVAKLSADDVIELKRAGLSDRLLAAVVSNPEPALRPAPGEVVPTSSRAAPPSTPRITAATLLSDPSIVYDGRYYYPTSYFSSSSSAYCSPALGVGIAPYYASWNCGGYAGATSCRGYERRSCVGVRSDFGGCASYGGRACHR